MANPLVHWELMVSDVARAKAFYQKVFAWTYEPMGPDYTLIQTGREPGGGMMQRPPAVEMSSLNSYFEVADIDRTLRAAVEAGATVVVPRTEIPTVGWFAMFLDLDQIPIGILQPLA